MVKEYTKNFQRAKDASHFVKFMKDTGTSQTKLGEAIGVSPGSISAWIKHNDAPKWTLLAIEALKRRMQGSSAVESEKIAALEKEIKQLKDGQAVEDGAAQRQESKQLVAWMDRAILELTELKYRLVFNRLE